ncbi:MAG: flagellar basal body rod protein FlgC [Alphaproteobacteria bacterium]
MSLSALNTALSGLQTASLRQMAAATNIARAGGASVADPARDAGPIEVVATASPQGVRGALVARDPGWLPEHDPSNPAADKDGTVFVPNISIEQEAISAISAEAAYMANLKMLEVSRDMQDELLDIIG